MRQEDESEPNPSQESTFESGARERDDHCNKLDEVNARRYRDELTSVGTREEDAGGFARFGDGRWTRGLRERFRGDRERRLTGWYRCDGSSRCRRKSRGVYRDSSLSHHCCHFGVESRVAGTGGAGC